MTDGLTASDVAVLTGGTGKNDGFGGDWGAWIILFLIFGMFGWGGFGGWGGNGGGANSPAFQGYATRADIDAALSTQGIENGIQNLSGQLCNGLAGVNANLSNLGYQMQQCCCDTREAIAGVNYNMAAQTNSILNALRPTPVPSYPVMSPYTSIVNPTGFSFGAGCGYGGNTGCGC